LTLFKPAKHRDLARIVTFEGITKAQKASRELQKKFDAALKRGDRERALIILRATQYAANRARAGSKNPRFKRETRRKWRRISEIYEKRSEIMERKYERVFGGK